MVASWRSWGSIIPRTNPGTIELHEDRIYDWISKGAQPSESVAKLFKTSGLTERYVRFKAGESLEVLMAEAKTAQDSRTAQPARPASASKLFSLIPLARPCAAGYPGRCKD